MTPLSRRSNKKGSESSAVLRQTTLFDDLPSLSASGKRRRSTGKHLPSSSPSKKRADLEDSSSDEMAAISFVPKEEKTTPSSVSSGDSSPMPKASLKGKSRRIVAASPSESEEESLLQHKVSHESRAHRSNASEGSEPPRKKRRLHRRKSSENVVSSDEDIAHLADEVEEERILETRLRKREKSRFQKNLERLRKRKLKLQDSDEDSGSDRNSGHQSEESSHTSRRFKGSKPSNELKSDNESDDKGLISGNSSDFIVEDDDAVQLPPEFSMETHQDLSHQFKKIFQFFVHIAVQPPKMRASYMQAQMIDEQYFSVPLQITRRKLSGLRDSLVSSSVWRPEFKRNLEKYPEFELTRLDFAVPSCDACHLGGRLSTLMGRLNGIYYNPCGFEPKRSKNKDEQNGKEFHLGRFCAKRTRVFHEFSHWEYNLFQAILQEINQLRTSVSSTGFHRVAYAGGREPPTDLEDADGLCDWLDKRKVIDMEWQRMKSMMESARHLDMDKDDMAD
ncbi:hypothetical protein BJ912DRAFT_519142 [Pholiota molesta]|nr:hypothetical protein BJ912DRAFT_519142 [Pholiota molesta]